jgi:hypothetical protein
MQLLIKYKFNADLFDVYAKPTCTLSYMTRSLIRISLTSIEENLRSYKTSRDNT